MLLGNPTGSDADEKAIEKDVIFVLDTSGSMRGEKIEQARAAIEYCLDRLNPGDRFNVVTFGTEVVSFRDAPVARTPDALAAAQTFIESVVAKGRTNIGGALAKVVEGKPEKDRPRITIFLTDGTPTAGELVPENILQSVKAVQPVATRIFVMGVGHDVNAHLLDKLAEATDGSSEYVGPDEEIDARVATLYDRLSHPVLTGVAIDFGELRPHAVYPQKLPALFKGSEVMVFGRYRGGGTHTIRVRGTLAGKSTEYACRAELPAEPDGQSNAFVAPLWAARKIGFLLQEIRLHGENDELITEVVRLSKKFGIVTEYTEFLAMLDVDVSNETAVGEAQRLMQYANRLQAGQWAVNQAFNDKELQNRVVATQGGNNYRDRRGNVVVNGNVRQFADQVFYLRDGQWVDAEEQGDRKTRVVKLFSPEYMELLRNNKDFARAQELGWAVSTNIDNERIVVENKGEQRMEELRRPQELRMNDVNRLQQAGPNQLQNFNELQQFRNQQMNQRQGQQLDINRRVIEQIRNNEIEKENR
ncbi:MAG: VWA domain-containing protein [Candidatus Nealsonbacteria bacterium]|nr:VWA domain-containing protein [Candidatus Nealsonbacteria bacterium]